MSNGKWNNMGMQFYNWQYFCPERPIAISVFIEIIPKVGNIIFFKQIALVYYILHYQNIHVDLGFWIGEYSECVEKHVRAYDLSPKMDSCVYGRI
jgi:hypothetical protein